MAETAPALPGQRQLGVMFADVAGSTRLFGTVGDVKAHALVEMCLGAVRASTRQFDGRVIKAIGDELLCVFAGPDAAIGAASGLQVGLDAQRAGGAAIPAMRVGVAYGPVLEDGADVFGDTVNLAARIAGLATAGQVLTNRATVEALPPLLRACCRELYAIELKGIEPKVVVHEVVWSNASDLTMVRGFAPVAAPVAAVGLRLSYRGRDLVLALNAAELRVGRDGQNDLVIESPMTSRRHARIRSSAGNFVLIDESANGTFVHFEGHPELFLRREDTVLLGRGTIGFGESALARGTATVDFVVGTD